MRHSSRPILSPGRNDCSRDLRSSTTTNTTATATLTTSLSRRLRHNNSLRGAQSPALFPSTKKNKGSSSSTFAENPEPSSPKVTCIGQVRVKTKKQGKKIKMRACGSKRVSGDASFRRVHRRSLSEPAVVTVATPESGGGRNQRWVHLPLSICESLKEFSCLIPCKSSCFSHSVHTNNDYYDNGGVSSSNNNNNCGVLRWLVSMQEGEGGKRRDIELIVGGNDEDEDDEICVEKEKEKEKQCSRRRSIFDDMEFDDLFVSNNCNNNNNNVGSEVCDDDVGGRVSVCVPPKNALLLMRCRSDPMRVASLSRKFQEEAVVLGEDEDDVGVSDVKEGNRVRVESREEVGVESVELNEVVDEEIDEVVEEIVELNEVVEEEIDEVGCELEVVEANVELNDVVDEEIDEIRGELEVVEANVELNEVVDEEINEICSELEVVEVNVVDLGVVFGEEWEEKLEEVEEVRVEEAGERRVVENREETEEEQRDVGVELKENREETGEEQSIETIEKENEVLANVDEVLKNVDETQLRLIEGENVANECTIEVVMLEEKVELSENEQDLIENSEAAGQKLENLEESQQALVAIVAEECSVEEVTVGERVKLHENVKYLVEMYENQPAQELQEEVEKEESYVLSGNSSNSLSSSEEVSKELGQKHEKDEVENELVEEEEQIECRKSMEKEKNNATTLPDCLLLMMCEPKLSMEVSKETWISSTDFIRWLPERHTSKKANKKTKAAAVAAQPPLPPASKPGVQPGRSSISFPANLKLAKTGVGYEPLVLTRCKSAPMRSTVKFAQPELGCSLWGRENGRKLEPHRPATCGVGAAGVGF